MDSFTILEKELEAEFFDALKKTRALKIKVDPFINDSIREYGAVGAVKRLMHTGIHKVQLGFTKLWENGRLDLTFEAVMVQEKYQVLFDDKTLQIAQKRLEQVGYTFPNSFGANDIV
jgi:hypothetical protein